MGDSITSIGDEAFAGDSLLILTQGRLPSKLETIGNLAFSNCMIGGSFSDGVLRFPAGIKRIGERAFERGGAYIGQDLRGVVWPSGIKTIGARMFGDQYIEKVVIPAEVERIGDGAFYWCALKTLEVDKKKPRYTVKNNLLMDKIDGVLVGYLQENPASRQGTDEKPDKRYSIPDGIRAVADYAFWNSDVSELVIPASLTAMGANTRNLVSKEQKEQLTGIGIYAQASPEYWKMKVTPDDWFRYSEGLYNVPEHLRTAELCRIAVQNRGYVLRYVPENLRTAELYRIAVQNNWRCAEVCARESAYCRTMQYRVGTQLLCN